MIKINFQRNSRLLKHDCLCFSINILESLKLIWVQRFPNLSAHLVSVRVSSGEGLIPPVDGVDVAVDAVVVGGVGTGGREVVDGV